MAARAPSFAEKMILCAHHVIHVPAPPPSVISHPPFCPCSSRSSAIQAKQPDDAASTSKAVLDNEYGGSSIDEQDGEDDPPAVDANAIPALDQEEEIRSYNKKYKNDGSSPLAGLRGFVALGDLLLTNVSNSGRIVRPCTSASPLTFLLTPR